MPPWLLCILGLVCGAAVGALAGFVVAIAVLSRTRRANRGRLARGEPPTKNEILLPFHLPGAVMGAISQAVLVCFYPFVWGVLAAAVAFPLFYLVMVFVAFVTVGRDTSSS